MSVGDIHHRESRLNNTIEKIKTSNEISDHNRELLLEFRNYLEAQDLSLDRTCRYLYNWCQLAEEINFNIDEAEKENIVELVRKIHQDEIRDDASKYQKMEWKKAIRKIYTDFLETHLAYKLQEDELLFRLPDVRYIGLSGRSHTNLYQNSCDLSRSS